MNYYPAFLDLRGKACLLAGGGVRTKGALKRGSFGSLRFKCINPIHHHSSLLFWREAIERDEAYEHSSAAC